jgi:sec-independent protein translocase protein TatB
MTRPSCVLDGRSMTGFCFMDGFVPVIAFFGGSVGASEWLILFAVILIVVGPRNLPELARKFGRTMEMFRRAADEFKEQLMNMDRDIGESVADAAGGVETGGIEGGESSDHGYDDPYAYDAGAYEDSGYPGNEEIAAQGADQPSAEENLETPDQAERTVSESAAASATPSELSDDPARGGTEEDKV